MKHLKDENVIITRRKITDRSDASSTVERRGCMTNKALRVAGLALLVASFAIWGTEFMPNLPLMASSLSLYALFVVLLFAAFASRLASPFHRLAAAPLASGFVATLAWLLSSTAAPQSALLFTLGSIVAGCAAAILVLSWGNELCDAAGSRTFVSEIVIAHGIVPLAHVVFLLAPAEVSYYVSAFYPLASGACASALRAARFQSQTASPAVLPCVDNGTSDTKARIRDDSFAIKHGQNGISIDASSGEAGVGIPFFRFVIACALASFVFTLIYNLYRVPEAKILHFDPVLDAIAFILRSMLLFLIAAALLKWRAPKQRSLFKAIFVLGIAGFLLFPLLGFSNIIPYFIIGLAFSLLGVFIWSSTALLCRMNCISPYKGFGIAIAPFEGLLGLPILAASFYAVSNVNSTMVSNVIVLIGIGTLALSYLFIMPSNAGDAEQSAVAFDGDNHGHQEREEALAAFADLYNLTARERDVLKLLTESKSRARICEELYISNGTLNTHVSHIYQKCEVHSKDELIDAFERVKADVVARRHLGASLK